MRFARESGTAGSDDLELSRPAGNVDQVAPKPVERLGRVCVRSLRTQQRTESQCQLIECSAAHLVGAGHFFGLLRDHFDASFFWGVVVLARVDQVSSHASFWGVRFPLLIPAFCAVDYMAFNGEFDPGSGRTLAACLTHASRTERPACGYSSGERVSNTWATCPQLWDNSGKPVLILDIDFCLAWGVVESFSAGDGPAAYQLVGGVMAYQGDDG